jgi:hypothetical protein
MVGRPCGQFQGCSISPMWSTSRRMSPAQHIIKACGSEFFLHWFWRCKKNIFPCFLLLTCPQAHHFQSKKYNFLLKFCVKMLICRHYFSPLNTIYEKKEGSGSGSVPLTNGSGSGRPKNMRILRNRISNTAILDNQRRVPGRDATLSSER